MANTEQPEDKSKSKFSIEKLSETTRKKIFGISIFILALLIIVAWIPSLQATLSQIKASPKKSIFGDQNLDDIEKDLNTMINQTKSDFEQIQKRVDQLNQLTIVSSTPTTTNSVASSTATSSIELSPDEIKILKEKILEQID